MNEYITYLIVGFCVLAAAIIINIAAKTLNIDTWYDYLQEIPDNGFWKATVNAGWSLIFLYLIYPFLLGLVAVISYNAIG